MTHVPVLLEKVVELLALRPGSNVLDCTVDGGGYAEKILEATGPFGALLGLDVDPSMLGISRERLARFGSRLHLKELNFRHLRIAAAEFGGPIHGIVADLGLSSVQLEDPKRGLSFMRSGPLDMRLSPKTALTAATILNQWPVFELRRIFELFGQERHGARIAEAIGQRRKRQRFIDTTDLSEFIGSFIRRQGKIHPATRIFQALRIATNDELRALEEALPQMLECLAPHGRIAILSYHSLEDRIVKHFFRNEQKNSTLAILKKKPITPTREEFLSNPRSRSAKLRVAEKR